MGFFNRKPEDDNPKNTQSRSMLALICALYVGYLGVGILKNLGEGTGQPPKWVMVLSGVGFIAFAVVFTIYLIRNYLIAQKQLREEENREADENEAAEEEAGAADENEAAEEEAGAADEK